MPKIKNKKEIFDGVENIINESFGLTSGTPTTKKFFDLSSKIDYLMDKCSSNKALVECLVKYKNMINPENEILLLESFIQDMEQFVSSAKVNKVRNQLVESIENNRSELQIAYLYESMEDMGVKNILQPQVYSYLNKQNDSNKYALNAILESVSGLGNQQVDKMYSILQSGQGLHVSNNQHTYLFESVNEVETPETAQVDIDELKENVNAYINEKLQEIEDSEAINENENRYTLDDISNKNGINLLESVVRLQNKVSNTKVQNILNEYYNALVNNAYEERLYETFYSNLSNYSYLLPVETELSALNKRIATNKHNIDLTKILEMMQATESYYIVPLIEHQIIDYMKNKTPNKKTELLFGLKPYGHDPYVRQIIDIVMLDQDKNANVMSESVLANIDKRKLVRENASVQNIYSPVQYIRENESVFNVGGIFYQKKGNNISRLDKTLISGLNESFLELCQLVNDSRVHINENNTITLSFNNKTALISEGSVSINGNVETSNTLRNLNEMYAKYNDWDTEFYVMATCLLEHFNDIAEINFGRRVVLNESDAYAIDLFNVNSNLFISTHDNIQHNHVFYKNVNPIQCKNIINEHMGLNVSALFENILPDQKSILESLNETKETYEEKIEELKALKDELQSKVDECDDEKDKKKLEDAIKDCEKDIEDAEKEFKEWQKESDKVLDGDSAKDTEDDETSEETSDEPKDSVTDDDIEDYSTPISDETPDFTDEIEPDLTPSEFDTDDGMPNLDAEDEFDDEFAPGDEDPNDDFSEMDFVGKDEIEDETEDVEFNGEKDDFDAEFDDMADSMMADFEEGDENLPEEDENVGGEFIEPNTNTDEPRVTGIYFDENVKSGKIMRSGTISITEPMIDQGGNKYIDTKNIQFYIDEENKPILNNMAISADLYNKAIEAIQNNPKFEEVLKVGVASENNDEITDEFDPVSIDMNPDVIEEIPVDDIVDDMGADFSDNISIPTYEYEGTDIEFPANNVSFESDAKGKNSDLIHESKKGVAKISAKFTSGNNHYMLSEGAVKRIKKTNKMKL